MLRVVLGVTGGIAAFKAASIVRLLTEAGHSVQVIPTANARRFIGDATLEALSRHSIDPDLYSDIESVKHVSIGQSADLVLVAPATAAFLARYSAGIADDLLLNTLLVTKAQVVVAPAMHAEMWSHASTQENVATLRSRGVVVIEPDDGRLTGADSGVGRLPEPEAIVAQALAATRGTTDWLGKRVLITAGGTIEPIDPVRFIGNRSSGKQGVAFAMAAASRGAKVCLVGANIPKPSGIDEFIAVSSALELNAAVEARLGSADLLIMAAAVSDFRVENPSEVKLKRSKQADLSLRLVPNPDLLAGFSAFIRENSLRCQTVGFAAETTADDESLIAAASEKLLSKNCDYLFANDVARAGVFESESNEGYLIRQGQAPIAIGGTKLEVAVQVLQHISGL